MSVSVSVFKINLALLTLFLLQACGDIPRDNLLDPKNEESYTQPVVLLEAFVNFACPGEYSRWAVQSLQNVEQTYPGRVLVAEYHRDLAGYDDAYVSGPSSSKFTSIQDVYIDDQLPERGVPDVFVNGSVQRVSGASSAVSVGEQITPSVDNLLAQKDYFLLQASVALTTEADTTCNVSCRVARLGNKTNKNLKMRVIIIRDEKQDLLHHRVLDVSLLQPIETLQAGEYLDVKFDPIVLSDIPTSVIVALFASDGKTALQAVQEEIK